MYEKLVSYASKQLENEIILRFFGKKIFCGKSSAAHYQLFSFQEKQIGD